MVKKGGLRNGWISRKKVILENVGIRCFQPGHQGKNIVIHCLDDGEIIVIFWYKKMIYRSVGGEQIGYLVQFFHLGGNGMQFLFQTALNRFHRIVLHWFDNRII